MDGVTRRRRRARSSRRVSRSASGTSQGARVGCATAQRRRSTGEALRISAEMRGAHRRAGGSGRANRRRTRARRRSGSRHGRRVGACLCLEAEMRAEADAMASERSNLPSAGGGAARKPTGCGSTWHAAFATGHQGGRARFTAWLQLSPRGCLDDVPESGAGTRITVSPRKDDIKGGVEGGHGAQLRAHGTRRDTARQVTRERAMNARAKPTTNSRSSSVTANTARALGGVEDPQRRRHQHQDRSQREHQPASTAWT